ncbi:MAG: hypothetical protein ACOVMM_02105 [Chitinophagaceae bacterium]
MNEVYKLKNEKSWQSAIVHENQILLINKSYKTKDEFLLKYNDKSIFRSTKAIDIESIYKISHLEKDTNSLSIFFNSNKNEKLEFEDKNEFKSFCDTIVSTKNFTPNVQSLSTLKAIQGALIGMVISIVAGWLLHNEASIIEAGGTIEITGRKKLFKQIIASTAETLGTTGSIIAATAAVAIFGYLAYSKYKNPPTEVVYQ